MRANVQSAFSFELLKANHLGVLTCILSLVCLVMAPLDNLEALCFFELYEDAADRDFALSDCKPSLLEGCFHKQLDSLLVQHVISTKNYRASPVVVPSCLECHRLLVEAVPSDLDTLLQTDSRLRMVLVAGLIARPEHCIQTLPLLACRRTFSPVVLVVRNA